MNRKKFFFCRMKCEREERIRREEKKNDAQICIRRLDCSYSISYSIPKRSLPTLVLYNARVVFTHARIALSPFILHAFFFRISHRMKYNTWAHVTLPHRSLFRALTQQHKQMSCLLGSFYVSDQLNRLTNSQVSQWTMCVYIQTCWSI